MDQALGMADHAFICVAGKDAFEQEKLGPVHQRALEPCVKRAFECVARIMQ